MPNISQQTNKDADRAAASLSFATMLSEGLMPKVQPEEIVEEAPQESLESPQTPETVPGEEIKPELEERVGEVEKKLDMEDYMADMEARMDEKLESFKEELLKAINKNATN